jgi:hypothetical protein
MPLEERPEWSCEPRAAGGRTHARTHTGTHLHILTHVHTHAQMQDPRRAQRASPFCEPGAPCRSMIANMPAALIQARACVGKAQDHHHHTHTHTHKAHTMPQDARLPSRPYAPHGPELARPNHRPQTALPAGWTRSSSLPGCVCRACAHTRQLRTNTFPPVQSAGAAAAPRAIPARVPTSRWST